MLALAAAFLAHLISSRIRTGKAGYRDFAGTALVIGTAGVAYYAIQKLAVALTVR